MLPSRHVAGDVAVIRLGGDGGDGDIRAGGLSPRRSGEGHQGQDAQRGDQRAGEAPGVKLLRSGQVVCSSGEATTPRACSWRTPGAARTRSAAALWSVSGHERGERVRPPTRDRTRHCCSHDYRRCFCFLPEPDSRWLSPGRWVRCACLNRASAPRRPRAPPAARRSLSAEASPRRHRRRAPRSTAPPALARPRAGGAPAGPSR